MIELIIIVISILLSLGIGGTVYYFSDKKKDNDEQNGEDKNDNEQNKNINDTKNSNIPNIKGGEKTETNNKNNKNNKNPSSNHNLKKNFIKSSKNSQQEKQRTGEDVVPSSNNDSEINNKEKPKEEPAKNIQETQKENKQNNVVSSKTKSSKDNKVIKKKSKKKTGNLIDNEIFERAFQHIEKEEEDKELEEVFEKFSKNFKKEAKNSKVLERIRKEDRNIYNAIISNAKKIYKAIFLFRNQKFKALCLFFHYFCYHDKNFSKASKDCELLANKLINIISEDLDPVNYHNTVLKVLSKNGGAFDFLTELLQEQPLEVKGEEFFTNEEINKLNDLVGKEKVTIRGYDEAIKYYSDLITQYLLSKNVEIKTNEEENIIRFFSMSILFFYRRHVSEFESFLYQEISNQHKDMIETLLEKTKNSDNIGDKNIQQVCDSLCKELQIGNLEDVNLEEPSVFLEEKLKMNDDSFEKNKIENETREFFSEKIKNKNFKNNGIKEKTNNKYLVLDEFIKIIKYFAVMKDMTMEQLHCLLLSTRCRLNDSSLEDIECLIDLFFDKNKKGNSVIDSLTDDAKKIILSENQKNPPIADKKNDVENNLENFHSHENNFDEIMV